MTYIPSLLIPLITREYDPRTCSEDRNVVSLGAQEEKEMVSSGYIALPVLRRQTCIYWVLPMIYPC